MTLGQTLRAARERKNISIAEVAYNIIGYYTRIPNKHVIMRDLVEMFENIEADKIKISPYYLWRLCKLYEIPYSKDLLILAKILV